MLTVIYFCCGKWKKSLTSYNVAVIKGAELKDSNALLYLQSFSFSNLRKGGSFLREPPFNFMSLPMGELISMLIEFEVLAGQGCVDLFLNYPGGAVWPLAGVRLKSHLLFRSFSEA